MKFLIKKQLKTESQLELLEEGLKNSIYRIWLKQSNPAKTAGVESFVKFIN
jgi:hypothetical protein